MNLVKRKLFFPFISIICVIGGQGSPGDEPKTPTEAERRESEVYSALGEMIVRRDRLQTKFAVVMRGEAVVVGRSEKLVASVPVLQVRAVDRARQFDLSAKYVVVDYQFESGYEVVREGSQWKFRDSSTLFCGEYTVKPKDQAIKSWLEDKDAGGFEPFDDFLVGNLMHRNGENLIERVILARYKLKEIKPGLNGQLTGRWWNGAPNREGDFDLSVKFDPAFEMMPTHVRLDGNFFKDYRDDVRYHWAKFGKSRLPKRIKISEIRPGQAGVITETTFKCEWLVGDEVPDEFFTAEDHLTTIMDHFKVPHTTLVNGSKEYVLHSLPEDLYDGPNDARRK